jgi:hypothetical protein
MEEVWWRGGGSVGGGVEPLLEKEKNIYIIVYFA